MFLQRDKKKKLKDGEGLLCVEQIARPVASNQKDEKNVCPGDWIGTRPNEDRNVVLCTEWEEMDERRKVSSANRKYYRTFILPKNDRDESKICQDHRRN